jgi:hypothetical protein
MQLHKFFFYKLAEVDNDKQLFVIVFFFFPYRFVSEEDDDKQPLSYFSMFLIFTVF